MPCPPSLRAGRGAELEDLGACGGQVSRVRVDRLDTRDSHVEDEAARGRGHERRAEHEHCDEGAHGRVVQVYC